MQPEEQRDARARYTIIPRVLVFLTRDAEVLLLRGAADKALWAEKYNGLGGHIESGETPYRAALREVQEEAGLLATALTLRAIVHIGLPEPPGVMLFVFVGAAPPGELRASAEGAPEWVALDQLQELPLVADLYELLPRVLTPGPLCFAEYRFTAQGLEISFD